MLKAIFNIIISFLIITISLISRSDDSTIKQVVSNINNSNIDNIIKEISGEIPVVIDGMEYFIKSRSNFGSLSYINPIAAKYIHQKLIEYGYASVFSPFRLYPEMKYDLETVYAIKIGSVNPNNIILFCSSHDSESRDDSLAPGANINASGLAIVLEAARLFKNMDTENTIIFASFDDMMQTGYGSFKLCDSLIKLKPNKLRGIFLESLGWSGGVGPVIGSDDTNKNNVLLYEALYVSNLLNSETKISGIVKDKITPIYYFSNKENNYEQVYFHHNFSKPYPFMRSKYDVFNNLEVKFLHENAGIAIGFLALVAGVIDKSLDVKDYSGNNPFSISPNPAGEYIEISVLNKGLQPLVPEQEIKIFNLLGECVLSVAQTFPSVDSGQTGMSDLLRVDVSGLPAGVYFVRVENWVVRFLKI